MKMIPVTSSHINSIGYDPAKRVLAVEYKTGVVYHHYDVDAKEHSELMRADSKGRYIEILRSWHPGVKQ